ncbi:MAG: FAD-dependent oxidoreductase [Anaerolineae bacterium]
MAIDFKSPKLSDRLLHAATQVSSLAWHVAPYLFPETLEVDDNRALWIDQTPDYRPGAALRETISADLAIIGGGFTGVSTAYHFSRRYPEKRVVLLEAKTLANGASGRNGGMMLNWVTGVTDHSPEMTTRIYQTTSAGVKLIQDIIERHKLNVGYRTDGTITAYTNAQRAEEAHKQTEKHRSWGIPEAFFDSAALRQKLNLHGTHGAVLDPHSGQINGAQLVRGLRPVLLEQGVQIYENTPVTKIREGATITLTTPQGEVRAKAIVLATNGYTGKLGYFHDALFPLHSHLRYRPLTPEQRERLSWRFRRILRRP